MYPLVEPPPSLFEDQIQCIIARCAKPWKVCDSESAVPASATRKPAPTPPTGKLQEGFGLRSAAPRTERINALHNIAVPPWRDDAQSHRRTAGADGHGAQRVRMPAQPPHHHRAPHMLQHLRHTWQDWSSAGRGAGRRIEQAIARWHAVCQHRLLWICKNLDDRLEHEKRYRMRRLRLNGE